MEHSEIARAIRFLLTLDDVSQRGNQDRSPFDQDALRPAAQAVERGGTVNFKPPGFDCASAGAAGAVTPEHIRELARNLATIEGP
jgi:hypothetical protein